MPTLQFTVVVDEEYVDRLGMCFTYGATSFEVKCSTLVRCETHDCETHDFDYEWYTLISGGKTWIGSRPFMIESDGEIVIFSSETYGEIAIPFADCIDALREAHLMIKRYVVAEDSRDSMLWHGRQLFDD